MNEAVSYEQTVAADMRAQYLRGLFANERRFSTSRVKLVETIGEAAIQEVDAHGLLIARRGLAKVELGFFARRHAGRVTASFDTALAEPKFVAALSVS